MNTSILRKIFQRGSGDSDRGERGIRTPGASQHGSFQDYCNRPLYHLSSASIFLKAGAKVRVFLELTKFYSDFLHKRMKNRTFAA